VALEFSHKIIEDIADEFLRFFDKKDSHTFITFYDSIKVYAFWKIGW
jgi:hypothetical protein